jgi:regulatory protein
MRAHLRRGGATPQDVERAVESLVEQGYLDDGRFVRLFVQDKRELEAWGSDRIRRTLASRGVDSDLIEDALTEQPAGGADDGEIDRALALLRKRFPSLTGDRRECERALGMLLRKGYDSDLALDAVAVHSRY